MKLFYLLFPFLILFTSCSSDDDSNPVSTEKIATGFVRGTVNSSSWYSNKITTSKSGNTRIVKATQEFTNDPVFKNSILEFRISVNQAGTFGIGENEPGYTYSVKAYYTLISRSGSADVIYKAYYESLKDLIINRISDKNLDANYSFNARTDDSLRTVSFTNGAIQIDY
jgi:hypothetical protein